MSMMKMNIHNVAKVVITPRRVFDEGMSTEFYAQDIQYIDQEGNVVFETTAYGSEKEGGMTVEVA